MMEYVEDLIRNGSRILPGSAGTYWAGYESTTMVRIPTFHLGPPTASEVRHVLWCGSAVTGCYLLEPDSRHPAKAWLYLCTDRAYALDGLPPVMHRNVRGDSRNLESFHSRSRSCSLTALPRSVTFVAARD
jgi:hypothetical protein